MPLRSDVGSALGPPQGLGVVDCDFRARAKRMYRCFVLQCWRGRSEESP